MNVNFALKVKEDLDKLLDIGFYLSHWNYTMDISFGDSTKEKWEVMNICGLL